MCNCTGPTHDPDCEFSATAERLKELAQRARRRYTRRRGAPLGEAERLWDRLDRIAEAVATPYLLRAVTRIANKPWTWLICRCGGRSWAATLTSHGRGPLKWYCTRCWRYALPRQNHILNESVGREAR